MMNINLKAVTSAFAALALTVVLSWTFVASTSVVHLPRDGGASFLSAVSILVR